MWQWSLNAIGPTGYLGRETVYKLQLMKFHERVSWIVLGVCQYSVKNNTYFTGIRNIHARNIFIVFCLYLYAWYKK